MWKIALGVIAGFVVWTILWLIVSPLVSLIAPELMPSADFSVIPVAFLLIVLLASVICSIAAGFTAVSVSKELPKTTLYLGAALLLVGILVEFSNWNLLPVWYHLMFLILLIPMTIFGGKLRKI